MVSKHHRRFSVRPTLTIKGRNFHGPRGWSGKPFHPPLTDIPVAAFILGAISDVVAVIGGSSGWAINFWRAGTYLFVAGLAISLLAVLTGVWDAWKSSDAGTQARRTINTHATIMSTVVVLAGINVIWRLIQFSDSTASVGIMILSVVTALLVAFGATYGGSLVFEYGFNVETGGDHHAWHESEIDVFPGQELDESATEDSEAQIGEVA